MSLTGRIFRITRFKQIFTKYVSVKEDEMGRACSTNGEKRNAYGTLVGKPEGKRTLGRLRRRWVDNIKMDLRDSMGYYRLD
jgi:hypothetical protein